MTPSPAGAAVGGSCAFVSITMSSGTSSTIVRSGDAIEFNDTPCDAATVSNTDVIDVSSPDGFDMFTVDLSGGPFAPGATDEGDGSSEIEMTVGRDSHISIFGSDQADHIAIDDLEDYEGLDNTANLNTDEAVLDDDISVGASSDYSLIDTGAGDDTVGMARTEAQITGGDGSDVFLIEDSGDIRIDGGAGYDMASYAANSRPISLATDGDLVIATAPDMYQVLSSIERSKATTLDDEISITDDAVVAALAGSDTIFASEGRTRVAGGAGYDSVVFRLSAPVKVLLKDGIGRSENTHTHFRGMEAITGTPNDDTIIPKGERHSSEPSNVSFPTPS